MRFRVPTRPFAPRGPSGRFPHLIAPTGALRLPAPPPRSLALARRFRLATEKTGPPKFLGDPRHTCPGSSTPAEPRAASLRGRVPYVALPRCRLPDPLLRRLPRLIPFRGPI